MSSVFEKIAKSVLRRMIKKGTDEVFRETKKKKSSPPIENPDPLKVHPWRLCPVGQHWVQEHPLTLPPSQTKPERTTIRRGHCRANPGKSELYTSEELREIAKRHFGELANDTEAMPVPDTLDFPHGNEYDQLIAGWTKFWNEVLQPKHPLTPDFVKALVATESGFKQPKDVKSNDGLARGLIQVTESTRKILRNPKGELKDHLIDLTIEESRDPVTNIAAGIRWLHHKKNLAERRLNQEITWEEAGAEYKGISHQLGKIERADRIMTDLKGFHRRLRDQRK